MTKEDIAKENKALKEELDCVRKKCECLYAEVEEHRRRAEHVQDMCNADVYQRAVHTYGETSRLILTIEEMSELTKELSKRIRGRNNMPAICEEMADVEIMLEQLKIVFNNRAAVDYHKAHKLQRLADRMTAQLIKEKLHRKPTPTAGGGKPIKEYRYE